MTSLLNNTNIFYRQAMPSNIFQYQFNPWWIDLGTAGIHYRVTVEAILNGIVYCSNNVITLTVVTTDPCYNTVHFVMPQTSFDTSPQY